jgi:hypothetical protein
MATNNIFKHSIFPPTVRSWEVYQEVSDEKEEHNHARCIYHHDTCHYTGASLWFFNSHTHADTYFSDNANIKTATNTYAGINIDTYINSYTYVNTDANADINTDTYTYRSSASTPWVGRQFRDSGKIRNLNHWDHLNCWRYWN